MLEQLRYAFARFYKNRFVLIQLSITGVLQFALWMYIVSHIRLYTDATFLHYTVGVGVDFVGSKGQIFALPIIGLIIALANTGLAYTMFKKARMTSLFLVTLTNLLHIFLLISAVLIVSLNA